jgi:hypothetical protein
MRELWSTENCFVCKYRREGLEIFAMNHRGYRSLAHTVAYAEIQFDLHSQESIFEKVNDGPPSIYYWRQERSHISPLYSNGAWWDGFHRVFILIASIGIEDGWPFGWIISLAA